MAEQRRVQRRMLGRVRRSAEGGAHRGAPTKRIVEVGSLVANLPEALLHDISVPTELRWIMVASPPGSSRYVQTLTCEGELRVEVSSNRFLSQEDRLSVSEERVLADLGFAPPEDEGWVCNWWWTGEGPDGCLAASFLIAEVVFEVFGIPLGFPLLLDRFSKLPPEPRAGPVRSS